MKTLELLNAPEATLTASIKQMKLKELEKHAGKILKALGQNDYEGVLAVVIKAVPNLGAEAEGESVDRFSALQAVIRKLLPEANEGEHHDQHTLERLALIMMVIVTRKYEDILAKQ